MTDAAGLAWVCLNVLVTRAAGGVVRVEVDVGDGLRPADSCVLDLLVDLRDVLSPDKAGDVRFVVGVTLEREVLAGSFGR